MLFGSIENSNYKEVDIKYITPKMIIISPLSNIRSWCLKETSEGDVSFMHPRTYVYAPNFEKVEGAYCFGLFRPSVCASFTKIKVQF